ncbi:hypothetical protein II906_10690 [bacterium]|nr:hypothetical protein [bacterium]
MANILEQRLKNPPVNKPVQQVPTPAFTINTDGKVKPLEDKATLLPSKIFGSPVEYAKDIKKDVVSIGKAIKGQANDHELGRINDLAMKGGALALATYLCIKNPLKLSKAMEFGGIATFFGAMALWPKLAIQAPLKLRTGVDIHQKYVDSQGRKKMVFQDPQYDLTNMFGREDLDRMGKKLKVNENLPDRDNFIKQRAKKTAVQGNTLWMLTAGLATPIMSALGSNALEKPLGNLIEKVSLDSSAKALKKALSDTGVTAADMRKVSEFIEQNKDRVLDNDLIQELSKVIGKDIPESVMGPVRAQLGALKGVKPVNIEAVKTAWKACFGNAAMPEIPAGMTNIDEIINYLSRNAGNYTKKNAEKVINENSQKLRNAIPNREVTLGDVKSSVEEIGGKVRGTFAKGNQALLKFIDARVGGAGSFKDNQWRRVTTKSIKALRLSGKQLKAIATKGDSSAIYAKLEELTKPGNEEALNAFLKKLSALFNGFEDTAGASFLETVETSAKTAVESLSPEAGKEYVQSVVRGAKDGAMGAQSSFFRLLQAVDVFRRAQGGVNSPLGKQLQAALGEGKTVTEGLVQACKDVIMNGSITAFNEKLKSAGFSLTADEYKAVMGVLFGGEVSKETTKVIGEKTATGLKKYLGEVKDKIANWVNKITPDLERTVVDGKTTGTDAAERTLLAGKTTIDMIKESATKMYNSNKWLKIFGGAMIALTAITITATLLIGRKGKTEKQVEQESKK